MNRAQFESDAFKFLNLIFGHIQNQNVEIKPHWFIDHLCYRAHTDDEYQSLCTKFLEFSDLLIETQVSGRMISTFKLHKPIVFNQFEIHLVELPAPKKNKFTETGFEHIEIVCDVVLLDLAKKYSHLSLDLGGLKKEINPELEIVFGRENLKFHNLSLEDVIQQERLQK